MDNLPGQQVKRKAGEPETLLSNVEERENCIQSIYKQYYPQLIKVLPMNDIMFITELSSHNLLPGDSKEKVRAKETTAEKAVFFLDKIIAPGITIEKYSQFEELLSVIKKNDNETLRLLADDIERDVTSSVNGCQRPRFGGSLSQSITSLKDQYKHQPPPCAYDLPEFATLKYVRLALVHKQNVKDEKQHLDDFTKHTIHKERNVIPNIKEKLHSINDIFYYGDKPYPTRILIEGGPGIGKSTLVFKICQEWAKGKLLHKFDIVLLIMFRNLQTMSLKDELQDLLKNDKAIVELGSYKVMLILDGFDEVSTVWQHDSFLTDLLTSRELPNATLVITCRPHTCVHLKGFERRIEVLGFDQEQIHEFTKNYTCQGTAGSQDDISKEFIKNLEMNPYISSLLHIPMCLAMIVEIYRHNKILPTNPHLTELLKAFVSCLILRQWENKSKTKPSKICASEKHQVIAQIFSDMPLEAIHIILLLSEVAYHAFFKWEGTMNEDGSLRSPKIIFTDKDLLQCGLTTADGNGFFQTVHSVSYPKSVTTYNFINLTLQEFFCALYICLLPAEEQFDIIQKYFEVFPYMFCYFFGLCRPIPSNIFQFVCLQLTGSDDSKNEKNDAVYKCAIKCICEAPVENARQISTLPFTIDMSYVAVFSYDCLCISYLLHRFPVSQLSLWLCKIGDEEAKQLAKHVTADSMSNGCVKELDLHWNRFTSYGNEFVMKLVNRNNSSLVKIDLGRNSLEDKGIELLTSAFSSPDVILYELSVWQCEFSAKGAQCIATMLETNKSIRILKMDGNDIGDEGAIAIANVLSKHELFTLYLNHCGFKFRGTEALVNNLKNCCHCKMLVLYLQRNRITKDGARLVASLASHVKEIKTNDKLKNNCEVKQPMCSSTFVIITLTLLCYICIHIVYSHLLSTY